MNVVPGDNFLVCFFGNVFYSLVSIFSLVFWYLCSVFLTSGVTFLPVSSQSQLEAGLVTVSLSFGLIGDFFSDRHSLYLSSGAGALQWGGVGVVSAAWVFGL